MFAYGYNFTESVTVNIRRKTTFDIPGLSSAVIKTGRNYHIVLHEKGGPIVKIVFNNVTETVFVKINRNVPDIAIKTLYRK